MFSSAKTFFPELIYLPELPNPARRVSFSTDVKKTDSEEKEFYDWLFHFLPVPLSTTQITATQGTAVCSETRWKSCHWDISSQQIMKLTGAAVVAGGSIVGPSVTSHPRQSLGWAGAGRRDKARVGVRVSFSGTECEAAVNREETRSASICGVTFLPPPTPNTHITDNTAACLQLF